MRLRTPVLAVLLLALPGCGGSREAMAPVATVSPTTARAQDFPTPSRGETLPELEGEAPGGPIFEPSVSLLERGTDRVGFALFDAARTQLSGLPVALYTSRPDGTGVRGPFVARSESLAVKTPFASRTTQDDPDAAKSVYVADVPFKREGPVTVTALTRMDGRLMRTGSSAMRVGAKGATPPGVGDAAIAIDTPTVASVGGDIAQIDTRRPPAPELHRVDVRDVLGKKPLVLVFATPQLCQSRVCGPVVDVALQVKATVGDRVSFVHQEVYKDNKVELGVRPQLGAYNLATEPWTFVIDRRGIVRARFEGALGPGELEAAVREVE